jgi:hypothetical protein
MHIVSFLSLLVLISNEFELSVVSFRMFPAGKMARMSFTQQAVTIRSDIYEPAVDSGVSREHLIDEELVTDDYSASLLADR